MCKSCSLQSYRLFCLQSHYCVKMLLSFSYCHSFTPSGIFYVSKVRMKLFSLCSAHKSHNSSQVYILSLSWCLFITALQMLHSTVSLISLICTISKNISERTGRFSCYIYFWSCTRFLYHESVSGNIWISPMHATYPTNSIVVDFATIIMSVSGDDCKLRSSQLYHFLRHHATSSPKSKYLRSLFFSFFPEGWELSTVWYLRIVYSQPVDFTRFKQSVCLLQRACPASGTASRTLCTCTRAMTRSSRVSCVTWGTTPSCGRKRTASDIASEYWPPGRIESRLTSVSMCCMTQVSRPQRRGSDASRVTVDWKGKRKHWKTWLHRQASWTTFWFHL